ncbi:MAG: sigma-70 family RNA polymerase sigma factor [Planctomycetes bacterium]|nr:sigma-70 family RNA polymerase sigma factor [Planctomycetota bacterium]MBL7144521.1 sigma-70 family RNA polymerase sigma factor [Phycisphaerae bacterium]
MLEDKRLIWELKQGNKDALRQIYMEYKDTLLTIAASLLHDTYAAEDVLHDVFVSFAASAGKLELRVSLKSYLISSVVNRVRDRFRKKKHHTVELDKAGQISSGSKNPEQLAVFAEQSHLSADALLKIPLEQREAIILHLNGGMTFKEIAEVQHVPMNTVQGRYRYGLDKLRTILNGEMKK